MTIKFWLQARTRHMACRHAIIIGGGASGVLLACQLLRLGNSGFRVTLIERRPEIGRGLAYHTGNPDHLLNVRAANMSALPEDPDHFWRWLSAHDGNRCGIAIASYPGASTEIMSPA
jgi:uncharacterized NAD(P)/FAD-binding protein YdhS